MGTEYAVYQPRHGQKRTVLGTSKTLCWGGKREHTASRDGLDYSVHNSVSVPRSRDRREAQPSINDLAAVCVCLLYGRAARNGRDCK